MLRPRSLVLPALALACPAAAAPAEVFEATLDTEPAERFLFLPFDVPEGTAEVRVAHDDLSDANILDWGLMGPDGFRGWHGGNRRDAVVGERAASPGYVPGPLAGRWEVIVGFAKIVERPVRYRVEVHLADEASLPPDPDRGPWVPPTPLRSGRRWYAGDFHVHSVESGDASPTLDEVAAEARRRGLDFVELSEHNTTSHLTLLSAVQRRHPDVLLLPGVEWTTYAGHANAIGVAGWVPFHVGARGLTAADAARAVAEQGGLFAPNHPTLDLAGLCTGCTWEHEVDVVHLGGVEIQTVSADVLGTVFTDGALALWDELCDRGAHAAAIGGSDDHEGGRPRSGFSSPLGTPTTYVEADELSVEAILAGLRASRTVVKLGGPDDPWVELDAPLRRAGSDTVVAERAELVARVEGARGGQLVLVRDGLPLAAVPVDADPFEHRLVVEAPADGETRVRAHLVTDGVLRTVTSHVWLARPAEGEDTGVEPVDEEGCGCASTRGAGASALAALLLAALAGRGRRA